MYDRQKRRTEIKRN